jgi:transcriptional regulator with XRE-family HTH domain
VAQWRVRRGLTQQMLADRIGKSKSWVDKVERGVRTLDRFSVIQEVARVLRVEASELVGGGIQPAAATGAVNRVDGIRAALACYDMLGVGDGGRPVPPAGEVARRLGHAWLTYEHADYPRLARMLPDLLGDAQRARSVDGGGEATGLLVQAYRITASALVKLGEPDLAWLAADRAMVVAGGDPLLAAMAAVPLGQALRAAGRVRLAMAAVIAAAHRIAPTVPRQGPPQELSLCGTLLVEAALAAAGCGDARSAGELLDQAAEIAERVDEDGGDHRSGCQPVAVEAARVLAAVELGDGGTAVAWHEKVTGRSAWARLPIEHRAAHLVDAARAYLHVGDLPRAGRALVEADRLAPAEIRCRPLARTVVGAVVTGGPALAGVARLASLVGLTR